MKLTPPFVISPRLLPAIRIGDGWLSLDSGGVFRLDAPGIEHTVTDYRPAPGSDMRRMFDDMLSFLGAAAESYRHRVFVRRLSEPMDDSNESLFPSEVVEWAYQNDSEIQCAQMDLENDITE
jgi:hypothetical protein